MSETVVYEPPRKHAHNLSNPDWQDVGTIVRCECGKYFQCRAVYANFGATREWIAIHWWNFKAHRNIRSSKPSEGEL